MTWAARLGGRPAWRLCVSIIWIGWTGVRCLGWAEPRLLAQMTWPSDSPELIHEQQIWSLGRREDRAGR